MKGSIPTMGKKAKLSATEIHEALQTLATTPAAAAAGLGKQVLQHLDKLDDRKRTVITMRYGITGEPPKTLQAIATQYSLTRERIRQIQNMALRNLCEAMQQA
ncbi:MAG: sigma factor-like helix-turn-helix DNA-binding protein [Lentisphaeria bacterium]|jgi:DNA-directed RNA polymerase sigma subunit (sigma70/sigma32)